MILIGLFAYLAICSVARHGLAWAWALAPGLSLSLAVEAWEIWGFYGAGGLAEAGPRGLFDIVLRHGGDVLTVNLAPLAVFLAARMLARRTRN